MSTRYVLDADHTPVPMEDDDTLLVWARWFETANRRVNKTDVGPYVVSTVFLGLDHRFDADGPPLLFETMVFARTASDGLHPGHDFDCRRYATWADAVAGHDITVQLVRTSLEHPHPFVTPPDRGEI